MKKLSVVVGAVALAVAAAMVPADLRAEVKKVGEQSGWDIIVDTSVELGCAMQAEYEGGTLVRMGFRPSDGDGYILVVNKAWKNVANKKNYKVSMDVEGGSTWDGDGEGFSLGSSKGYLVSFDDPDFFVDVMKKQSLTLSAEGKEIVAVSLDGTYKALSLVSACQEAASK